MVLSGLTGHNRREPILVNLRTRPQPKRGEVWVSGREKYGVFALPSFSGNDAASRAWRREQMQISCDYEGLPRDRHADAMCAALDALNISDGDRVRALTAYFKSLAVMAAESDSSGETCIG